MRTQRQTDLPLDDAVDQQPNDREHRQGGNAFRFLQPHGSNGRGVLDPTKTGFYGRILVLIGLENLGIRASLSGSPFNMCPNLAKLLPHLRGHPYLAWR